MNLLKKLLINSEKNGLNLKKMTKRIFTTLLFIILYCNVRVLEKGLLEAELRIPLGGGCK
jgi:hypothetical protein